MIREHFDVEIENIKVGTRSYSFDYKFYRNGKLVKGDHYTGGHSRAHSTMRKYLNKGYAVELVLQNEME